MSWLQYLLQVNIYLILLYGLYAVLLRNETFFKLNRLYLLTSGVLAFLIPVLQIDWIRSLFITEQVRQTTNALSVVLYRSAPDIVIYARPGNSWTFSNWLAFIYFTGVILFFIRFLWNLTVLYRTSFKNLSKSRAHSFFKKVIVSDDLDGRETILEHEKVHSLQWHSADVLFFEFIAIINWFNPAAYACKKAIKYIHEFIADEVAASTQNSKEAYSLLLVSNLFGIESQKLSNGFFNQSLIKRRIIMLHKSKSNRTALLKYGFSIPLFFSMLIFSSAILSNGNLISYAKEIRAAGTSLKKIIIQDTHPITSEPAPEENNGLPVQLVNEKVSQPPPENYNNDDLIADSSPVTENITSESAGPKDALPVMMNVVQVSPRFPGGEEEWIKFLQKYNFPATAAQARVSGRVVVQFVIERDGSLTEMTVLHDLGYGTGAEAVRLLKSSPKWIPGIMNGRTVRTQYIQPISLLLSAKDKNHSSRLRESEDLQVGSLAPKSSGHFFILNGKKATESEIKNIGQNLLQRIAVRSVPKQELEKYDHSPVRHLIDLISKPLTRNTLNIYPDKNKDGM